MIYDWPLDCSLHCGMGGFRFSPLALEICREKVMSMHCSLSLSLSLCHGDEDFSHGHCVSWKLIVTIRWLSSRWRATEGEYNISSAVRRFGGVSFCYVDRHIRIKTVSFYWQSEQRVAPTIFILTLLSKRVIHAARSSLPIALSNQTHSFDGYIQTRTKYSRRRNVVTWILV